MLSLQFVDVESLESSGTYSPESSPDSLPRVTPTNITGPDNFSVLSMTPPHYMPMATSTDHSPMSVTTTHLPLSLRISLLNLKLLSAENKQMTATQEIQTFYSVNAARIESDRYQALCDASTRPWQLSSIDQIYDYHHGLLITRAEEWCQALDATTRIESTTSGYSNIRTKSNTNSSMSIPHTTTTTAQSIGTPASYTNTSLVVPTMFTPPNTLPNNTSGTSSRKCNRRTRLTPTAISIMERWYQHNEEHPYPNQEATQLLATAGSISPEQVKKWFANRRLRNGNTKDLTEIARRRKRPLDSEETFSKRMRQL